ncbi:MAG TPA: N-acetyltransferase [Campylobacterales bacterium]|nr:N-acetyltransferase [Campylobacterales bacterium]
MEIEIASPTLRDIPEMVSLLELEIASGNILYRSNDEIATNIRSYLIAKSRDKIVGLVALHIYSVELGEFRSLVVMQKYRNRGVGRFLIQKGIEEGRRLGLSKILVLTYRKEFFQKLGFSEIEKLDIPNSKIWADCIKCSHFPICDEVALILNLEKVDT